MTATAQASPPTTDQDLTAFEADRPSADQNALNLIAYGIGPGEIVLLDELGTLIAPELDRILEDFYAGVRLAPELSHFFSEESLYDHAKSRQKTHWLGMLSSGIESSGYAASCDIIGATHFRIGLPFEHYMAAYARVGGELQKIVLRSKRGWGRAASDRVERLVDLLSRIIVMDMERAISAFFLAQREAEVAKLVSLSEAMEDEVGTVVNGVSSASVELSSTAAGMVEAGESAQRQVNNARTLSDDMAGHVQGVASAVEQLSASITQISKQVQESTIISDKARRGAQQAGETVQELDKAVSDIKTVLELISSIAKQTNLLALNATVEAARSGEAGRGFAVVALEIKSLSDRISSATREINERIGDIRNRTTEVVTGTGAIVEAISSLDATTSAISAAVSQQNDATQDIASSAETTAGRTSQMADAMHDVDRVVADMAGSSRNVANAAASLQRQATQLQSTTSQFAENMARL